MSKRLRDPFRYQPFIAKLEQGQREHFFDYVERNIPRLEAIIAEMMEFQYRLAWKGARGKSGTGMSRLRTGGRCVGRRERAG